MVKNKEITFKKPPDKYNCIKVSFDKIIKDNNTKNKIFDCVIRTNKITIKTYQLLRLWILDKYHKKEDIPAITEDTIKMAQKSILEKSPGPKPKGDNLELFNEFQKFHTFTLENGVNLSQILGYNATSIITAIENNIKMHYFDYIRRFINSCFKHKFKEEMKDKEFKKQLFKDLKKLKNDIINNTTTCDTKYQTWLKENRYSIIPKEVHKNGYYYDIQIKPQKYLKYMIWMNIELEKIDGTMYQFMPLRSDLIVKHIPLDTKSLIEIFVEKDKNKYLCDIENTKDELWKKYFNINISLKNYVFDYTIITDCYSASLRFIHKDRLYEENDKKEKMRNAKEEYKDLSKQEIEILKKNKKEEQKQLNKNKPKVKKVKINYIDFPYIDEVDKNELEGKCIYIDPGKRDLLSIIDDDGDRFTYSNKQRVKETKRLKYQRLIKNLKDRLGICEIENTLSIYNSKTCDIEKFKKYIEEKNKVNEKLFKLYEDKKFRQYKWYGYINKKRTEDNMNNLIKQKFGKNINIVYGDWGVTKQMRNFISTPNLGIKRKLKEKFNVFNIDEYRTSCLHYKTEEKGNNFYETDKINKRRKLHSVLTFQMETTENESKKIRIDCINRDYNGCLNIRKIYKSYMNNEDRPQNYCRGFDYQKLPIPEKASSGSRLERRKGISSESAFI